MSRLASILVIGLFSLACVAQAAPILDIASVNTTPGATPTINVTVSDTAAETIFGYNLDFVIQPQAGATGTVTFPNSGAVTDAAPPFFAGSPPAGSVNAINSNNTDVNTSNFDLGGYPGPISTGTPLLNLAADVSPNASGTFSVSVFQQAGSPFDGQFLNGSGNPIAGASFGTGTITVGAVPEPDTLVLAAAAGCALAGFWQRRRRRAAV